MLIKIAEHNGCGNNSGGAFLKKVFPSTTSTKTLKMQFYTYCNKENPYNHSTI